MAESDRQHKLWTPLPGEIRCIVCGKRIPLTGRLGDCKLKEVDTDKKEFKGQEGFA